MLNDTLLFCSSVNGIIEIFYYPCKIDTYSLFELVLWVQFQILPDVIGQFHSNEAVELVLKQIIDDNNFDKNLEIFKLLRGMGETTPNKRIFLPNLDVNSLENIFNSII
jgi:hypothetical protein